MVTVKAPGKLYLAGEYAIVETGKPAILIAVDQFVYATIKGSAKGHLASKQLKKEIYWTRENDLLTSKDLSKDFSYVLEAIKLTERYAKEQGKTLQTFDLSLDSDLDSPDGKKYGLGSSAAVTVAVVKALDKFYALDLSKLEIFKIAALAHYLVQKNGSLGDIAASSFGGWIAYYSCDRTWLLDMVAKHSITEIVALKWPNLQITPLTPPTDLRLLIGWTKSPSLTADLVKEVSLTKDERQKKYELFLQESADCVTEMIKGFSKNDLELVLKQVARNRKLLRDLENISQVVIETPTLEKLIELTIKAGGQAKTSGAGGGDCGIAFLPKDIAYKDLLNAWRKNQIEPLNIKVYTEQKGN